jgi:tetratricopeptide (TPR) repeat protein
MFARGRSASALARYKKAAELAQQSSDKDLEAEMWFNAATAEARMGREKQASRSMQRAIDIAQDRRNYKLAAHICLAVCIENIKNEEAQESGKFFANAVMFSLLVSPQYAAAIMGQLLILVRDMINAKKDTLARGMIDSAVRNLKKINVNIGRPLLDSFLLPLKRYLALAEREAFEKFVLKITRYGVR